MVYVQPRCDYAWARRGSRAVVVFRHEISPIPLDENKIYTEEERRIADEALALYQQRSDHTLELSGINAKFSAATMGGASSTLTEVDNRSKYVELGRRYAQVQDTKLKGKAFSSPGASPARKKAKNQTTPESRSMTMRTPSSSSSVSSLFSSTSAQGSVERYKGGTGELGELVTAMTSTISQLTAEVNTLRLNQEAQSKANDNRHTATETKLRTFETSIANVEKTISGSTLKAMLRSIRDEANKLEAMEREKQIYIKQYNSATSERKAELEGKIEIVDNQLQSQLRMLESLREDAIDQANQDGVILSDAQLRNVV